jgi:hypothetical protein
VCVVCGASDPSRHQTGLQPVLSGGDQPRPDLHAAHHHHQHQSHPGKGGGGLGELNSREVESGRAQLMEVESGDLNTVQIAQLEGGGELSSRGVESGELSSREVESGRDQL